MRSAPRWHVPQKTGSSEIAVRLRRALPVTALTVSGGDSRALQTLVSVAAKEGYEIRDPRGHLLRAAARLTIAQGYAPQGRRLRHRWTVTVMMPTVALTDGLEQRIDHWGNRVTGRRAVFAPGATLDLSQGDSF